MSKEKQIEEMALSLAEGGCGSKCDCIQGDKFNCHLLHSASVLYEAGYRKQIEGEWIEEHGKTYIPAEYDDDGYLILHDYTTNVCSVCGRRESKKEPYCNCGAWMKGSSE